MKKSVTVPFLPIFACRGGPGSAAPRGGGPRGTQKLIIFWFFCSPEPFTKIFWKRKPRENLAKTLRKPPENLPKTSRKPRENLANTLGILWYQCSYGTLLFNLMLEAMHGVFCPIRMSFWMNALELTGTPYGYLRKNGCLRATGPGRSNFFGYRSYQFLRAAGAPVRRRRGAGAPAARKN